MLVPVATLPFIIIHANVAYTKVIAFLSVATLASLSLCQRRITWYCASLETCSQSRPKSLFRKEFPVQIRALALFSPPGQSSRPDLNILSLARLVPDFSPGSKCADSLSSSGTLRTSCFRESGRWRFFVGLGVS